MEYQETGNTIGYDSAGDPDNDGRTNLEEFNAGTDANKASSHFTVTGIAPSEGDALEIQWTSEYGKTYTIRYSTNLVTDPFSNRDVLRISATPPLNTYQLSPSENTGFYRVDPE